MKAIDEKTLLLLLDVAVANCCYIDVSSYEEVVADYLEFVSQLSNKSINGRLTRIKKALNKGG